MAKKTLTYEAAMAELQQITAALQEEAVSMDDLSGKVARAAELLTYCREKLRKTEEETNKFFTEQG